MDEKINIDLRSLKFILNKNRPYIASFIVIIISIILFIQFVIPQYQALLTVQKQVKEISLRTVMLKANLDVLSNINDEVLNSQLKILNSALPLSKDLVGMLNSIYSTAQKTGVSLGSFSIKVGNLSESENNSNFSVVKLSVPINSGVMAVNNFVEVINKTFPLSDVTFVKIGEKSSTVDLSFYYMPLSASNYSQDARISAISQKGLKLIDQLSKYENTSFSEPSESTTNSASLDTSAPIDTSVPVATPSAAQ